MTVDTNREGEREGENGKNDELSLRLYWCIGAYTHTCLCAHICFITAITDMFGYVQTAGQTDSNPFFCPYVTL